MKNQPKTIPVKSPHDLPPDVSPVLHVACLMGSSTYHLAALKKGREWSAACGAGEGSGQRHQLGELAKWLQFRLCRACVQWATSPPAPAGKENPTP